jgi:hypothetical protein
MHSLNSSTIVHLNPNCTKPTFPLCSNYTILVEFQDDNDLYILKPVQYVGIEVWQVENTAGDQAFVLS